MGLSFIKLDINIMNDSKIKQIRKMPAGNDMIILWVGLLCLGMRSGRSGVVEIGENIPYDAEMLSVEFDIEKRTVELALNIFQRFGMIEIFSNGSILISNFEKHQELERIEKTKQSQRERTRRFREKNRKSLPPPSKNADLIEDVTVTQLLPNIETTTCNALDIDLDTDLKKDKDKDKDDFEFEGWKKDFSIYKKYVEAGFSEAMNDSEFLNELNTSFEALDVKKTVRVSYNEYWSVESGWMKRKGGRAKKINFKETIRNILRSNIKPIYKGKPQYTQQSIFDNSSEFRPEGRILNGRR